MIGNDNAIAELQSLRHRLEDRERKRNKKGREANSCGHLKPMVPEGSQHLHLQKRSQNINEQRRLISWTQAQRQDLGNHPLVQTLVFFQEKTESKRQKELFWP